MRVGGRAQEFKRSQWSSEILFVKSTIQKMANLEIRPERSVTVIYGSREGRQVPKIPFLKVIFCPRFRGWPVTFKELLVHAWDGVWVTS